ncbi:papain-like cysteine protease family protein [Aphanizomenon flos-aquae]|uniref:papain-like cysteine protease family protein n=1 Tax=Aphanizomenon flos-aquae TaxID=1176 RepID=UPI000487FA08|nr:papain-like cysteine protease family protein [Aphanizomenon flos-aquae]
MEEYFLNVPLVGQKDGYDGSPLLQPDRYSDLVQHGFMACLYASACMVSYYFRAGPRLGLPNIWTKDRGISINAINELAEVEGLRVLKRPELVITNKFIMESLREYGPIWIAGYYLDHKPKVAHAVVVTGIQGNSIHYNDPWEPEAKVKSVEWLNAGMLDGFPDVLLVKDKSRY